MQNELYRRWCHYSVVCVSTISPWAPVQVNRLQLQEIIPGICRNEIRMFLRFCWALLLLYFLQLWWSRYTRRMNLVWEKWCRVAIYIDNLSTTISFIKKHHSQQDHSSRQGLKCVEVLLGMAWSQCFWPAPLFLAAVLFTCATSLVNNSILNNAHAVSEFAFAVCRTVVLGSKLPMPLSQLRCEANTALQLCLETLPPKVHVRQVAPPLAVLWRKVPLALPALVTWRVRPETVTLYLKL